MKGAKFKLQTTQKRSHVRTGVGGGAFSWLLRRMYCLHFAFCILN
jgi:hypothetical protein